MKLVIKNYFLFIILLGWLPVLASAQMNEKYFEANQLLRQQNFEEAYHLFEQLHHDNPDNFRYLDKASECLVNLKEYDKATSLIEQGIKEQNMGPQALIRLGEIHHINGDTTKAFSVWNNALEKYEGNQQVYLDIAGAMKERRAYKRAIELYTTIRNEFPRSRLIATELAETYLQAGLYEKAIQQFLQIVQKRPNQIGYVQNRLMRFQDKHMYDIAIQELSVFLDSLGTDHQSFHTLKQLEVWLLMERNHSQQALATARDFEERTQSTTYLLYSLGSKLLADRRFDLAEQAYSYYIEKDISDAKFRSMEELAKVYRQWARYLENYNLGLSSQHNGLYKKAFSTLEKLHSEASHYRQMDKVLITLSELSLDVLHQPEQVRQYLDKLRSLSDSSLMAQELYIEGRLHLYDEEYNRARIAFSESNRQNDRSSLAQKTRFYLALTDFYTEDYEFSKIQLNALERQNTSHYANDAIKLRMWIQEGLQSDSTGSKLQPLASSKEYFAQGKYRHGINELKSLFQKNFNHPLADEALLELSTHNQPQHAVYVYRVLNKYLSTGGTASPLYERLLWEKARIADQFVTNEDISIDLYSHTEEDNTKEINLPATVAQLIPLYEDILMNFPSGFYASHVRERLKELQNTHP